MNSLAFPLRVETHRLGSFARLTRHRCSLALFLRLDPYLFVLSVLLLLLVCSCAMRVVFVLALIICSFLSLFFRLRTCLFVPFSSF